MEIIEDGGCVGAGVATALSMGVYDGVHLGHQALIKTLRRQAERSGVASAVVTFDQHPALVLRPENAPKLLTTLDQKLELLDGHGVDYVYVVRFTAERARTEPADFVADVFVRGLNARHVVVGEDFHFGRDRHGNVDVLRGLGEHHGFDVIGIELVAAGQDPEPISSTAIRRALAGGDVAKAARMLGRPYEVCGTVERGDQRGRAIGFPTANIPVSKALAWPADAVYAGWYTHPDGTTSMAAINIGRRPTFYEHAEQSLLEAHLLDFEGDLYGEAARVGFVELLRSEQRFDGIDALVAQLKRDIERAREILEARG